MIIKQVPNSLLIWPWAKSVNVCAINSTFQGTWNKIQEPRLELKTITGTKNIFYANIIDLFDFIQRHNIDTIIRVSIYYYQLASYDVNRIEKGAFPTLKLRKKLLYFESHKI